MSKHQSRQADEDILHTFFPAVSSSVVMSLMPEASICFSVAEGIWIGTGTGQADQHVHVIVSGALHVSNE